MHRYVETDDDDDGFAPFEGVLKTSTISLASTKPPKSRQLSQYIEADESFDMGTLKARPSNMDQQLEQLEELDLEDFGTIKGRSFKSKMKGDFSEEMDANATLKARKRPVLFAENDDFETDFEIPANFRPTMASRTPQGPSDLNVSDSDGSSARLSLSSSLSSVSSLAQPLDDSDFAGDGDLEAGDFDLKARLKARERKAEIDDLRNFAPPPTLRGSSSQNTAWNDDDDMGGLDFEALDFTRGTVNKNVIVGYAQQLEQQRSAVASQMASLDRQLRSVQSIARLPDRRKTSANLATSPHRLRPAKSMYNLEATTSSTPRRLMDHPLEHRPLTQYIEPDRPVVSPRKHSQRPANSTATSTAGLHTRRKRNVGLIRGTAALQSQELNGMVFNPQRGVWEGNESEEQRFDFALAKRPTLIAPTQQAPAAQDRMVFDKQNLCWIRQGSGSDDDVDPFAGLGELAVSTPARGSSFGSSIGRRESTSAETFSVAKDTRVRWRKNDERFNRKFGRWVARDGARVSLDMAPAYDLFKMIRD